MAELIEVLSRQDPTHEVHALIGKEYGDLIDVRVDDQAQTVTLIGGDAD